MEWRFNNNEPIYLQIVERIKIKIIDGHYLPNTQIPSVRQLADEISVNPNTVQKAMTQLEEEGLVYTQGTIGRFINPDPALPQNLKNDLAKKYLHDFYSTMRRLRINREQIIALITQDESEEKS